MAELHVQQATGLDTAVGGRSIEVVPVNRTAFTSHTLDAYRPLFETLAGSLGQTPTIADERPSSERDLSGDPEDRDAGLAMLGQLLGLVAPTMLGMAIGSMVGRLARRSFGQYDLPAPPADRPARSRSCRRRSRPSPATGACPEEELLLWVCLHQLTTHAVLGVPHVRAELEQLLRDHAGGFRPDPGAVTRAPRPPSTSGGTDSLGELQQLFGDPEVLLGAVRSPEQERLRPQLDALVAVVVGFVDHTVDRAAAGLHVQRRPDRRGRPPPPAGSRAARTCSWSACWASRSPGPRSSGAGPSSSGVIEREGDDGLSPAVDARPGPCPRRPRSTPPACGWPASRSTGTSHRRAEVASAGERRASGGAAGPRGP